MSRIATRRPVYVNIVKSTVEHGVISRDHPMHKRSLVALAIVLPAASPGAWPSALATAVPTPTCNVRGSHQWLSTRPSPLDSAVVAIGDATALICYSRPQARGRSVDSLVPRGLAWRLGANEPTTLTLSNAMSVGGVRLGAGRYVLLAVPGDAKWTVVFHTTPDSEPAKMFQTMKQVAMGTASAERVAPLVEQFTIRAAPDGVPAFLLEWGPWRVRLPVAAP
jgi:hypothetical protein